ncbi:Holliday junction resolvase RuvX [Atopobacter sp. AH10]|uniref:Holliday junction resolvase RuvX n=1 Tax=Atopobacter sp. AH10 TaxID=2315861 RepID=UPI000EF1AA85|nr:Holliday junction resolvase RuvX [Atopobacter sp. AH10]RLK62989.1 Holliday junction resolvase RuvX [Atopobacter sp. AH10]
MRLMGLDVGSKTVGVAVSDPLGWTAQGIEIVSINEELEEWHLDRLQEIIEAYEVEKVVIGLPKNMDNSEGIRAEAARNYGELLHSSLGLPVVYQDERLSTVAAERLLIDEGNVSRRKRKQVIDKLAAVIILQTYLDRQAHKSI